ncbi:SMI1/KNR4 family protein [Streptomyces sp. NPDC020965]|uniref:SMI1/KNR4 family protein n=1 Tax=Streptomyces sp. NPDC020965 TaxID=3365105 RepID=UPI0037990D16
MPSIHDFATWEPVLRLLRAGNAESTTTDCRVAGRIGPQGWSLPPRRQPPTPDGAARPDNARDELDAVQPVLNALADIGVDDISFTAEIAPTGKTVLYLLADSPAVEPGIGNPYPGSLILVDGALPEPWRRLPVPAPGASPAPPVDPAALERTLRERLPDAIGATDAEIAAAEARLGIALPDELKAVFRVVRARWEDWGDDYDAACRVFSAVGCELYSLDELSIADVPSRAWPWELAAMEAVETPPDAAVQGLVGSPGWIAFGDSGGGDRIAVDLTPGPRGHIGQIIILNHEECIGAGLVADSLTDLVVNGHKQGRGAPREEPPPPVAWVNIHGLPSVEAAAHEGLEVLSIGVWEGEPVSLAPVIGLPRLRTLAAYPGTLADPLEIAELTGLEFLELGPDDWRVLLDAGAVPRGLSAAAIEAHGNPSTLPIVDLANEILALWDRPPIIRTRYEGDLGPVA